MYNKTSLHKVPLEKAYNSEFLKKNSTAVCFSDKIPIPKFLLGKVEKCSVPKNCSKSELISAYIQGTKI